MSTFIRLESKSEALIGSLSKAFGWQAWLQQGVELVEGGHCLNVDYLTFVHPALQDGEALLPPALPPKKKNKNNKSTETRFCSHFSSDCTWLSVALSALRSRRLARVGKGNLLVVPFLAPAEPSTHLSEPTQVIRDHASTLMSESTPLLLSWPQPVRPSVCPPPQPLRGPGGRRQSNWRSRRHWPWWARRRRRRARRQLAARTAPPGRQSGGRTRRLGPSTLFPPPSGAAEEKTQPRGGVSHTSCTACGLWWKLAANTRLKSVLKRM